MDHGTLGLLWGMMLIVGITMRTGATNLTAQFLPTMKIKAFVQ